MRKGVIAVLALLLLPSVLAANVVLVNTTATLITVSVEDATNMYAYEVKLNYTGTYSDPTFSGFLGGSTTSGSSLRGTILSVYESKLDSSQTGVNGSGTLFTISHNGDMSLYSLKAVDSSGSSETTNYVTATTTTDSGSSGSTTGGGSSGGGSTEQASGPVNITANVSEINAQAIFGKGATSIPFTITNRGTSSITVQFSLSNSLAGSVAPPAKLVIPAGATREAVMRVTPATRSVTAGILTASVGGTSYISIPVVISPRSENFLFDAALTLADSDRKISQGQSLRSQINLLQVGSPQKVDVVATYVIKDYSGNTLLEESETFYVEQSKDLVKEFPTNNLPPGKYVLGLEIVYPNAFATSSTQFEITEPSSVIAGSSLWLIIGGIALLIVIIVVFYVLNRRPTLQVRRAGRR